MQLTQLGTVAALASVSKGFLIPPEISSADTDIIKTLPFEDAVGIDGRVMEINCPGCPVVTDLEGKLHSVQADSILQLNFSTSHNNGADQLLLNGLQLYPIDPQSESFMEPLTASQMIKSADDTWQYASTPKLGYSLSIKHPASTGQDQLNLVVIHLEIIEVADKLITGLPTIDLQLLETSSGKLMIGNTGITAPANVSSPTEDDKECTTLLCKWRAIVADRLAALKKGCGSKRPKPEVRPVFVPKPHHGNKHHGGHSRPPPGIRPHHGAHRPYRHHHRHGGFARFVRGIVLHVFVPILIGIMVGITASLIGMVVGHIVIFTWRLLFRRGQSKYAEVKQEEAEEEAEDESKSFLEHQGPPPQYEDAIPEKNDSE